MLPALDADHRRATAVLFDIARVELNDLGVAFHDHMVNFDQHTIDFAHLFTNRNNSSIELGAMIEKINMRLIQ